MRHNTKPQFVPSRTPRKPRKGRSEFLGSRIGQSGVLPDKGNSIDNVRSGGDEVSSEHQDEDLVCKLPKERKAVSCKCVFRIKRSEDGGIDRYQARRVACGFSLRYDYTDTCAPVARLDTVRTVLAVVNQERLEVHQIDVKNTVFEWETSRIYLYDTTREGVDGEEDVICLLNRALYSLNQASRA